MTIAGRPEAKPFTLFFKNVSMSPAKCDLAAGMVLDSAKCALAAVRAGFALNIVKNLIGVDSERRVTKRFLAAVWAGFEFEFVSDLKGFDSADNVLAAVWAKLAPSGFTEVRGWIKACSGCSPASGLRPMSLTIRRDSIQQTVFWLQPELTLHPTGVWKYGANRVLGAARASIAHSRFGGFGGLGPRNVFCLQSGQLSCPIYIQMGGAGFNKQVLWLQSG